MSGSRMQGCGLGPLVWEWAPGRWAVLVDQRARPATEDEALCRADGRWVCRGFRRAFALRLEEAGLVMASGGYQGPFEIRFTEAWLTPAGRGLWWLLEEAYAETMPMLYDALRQQAAERAAGPV